VTPEPLPAPAPLPQPTAADKQIVIDPAVAGALRAVKVQWSTTGVEGYLKIQVDVENRSDVSQRFRYAIEWLNGNGAILPQGGNSFLDWMLMPHETSTIVATAPTAAAKDFRLLFVGAKP
jgi:uncharacterized protein YcfL